MDANQSFSRHGTQHSQRHSKGFECRLHMVWHLYHIFLRSCTRMVVYSGFLHGFLDGFYMFLLFAFNGAT